MPFDANCAKKDNNNVDDDQDVSFKFQTNEQPHQVRSAFFAKEKNALLQGASTRHKVVLVIM